jgi:hypothetical protein
MASDGIARSSDNAECESLKMAALLRREWIQLHQQANEKHCSMMAQGSVISRRRLSLNLLNP